ncbi:MAG: Ig-like domain-containing protein, partial [Leifsonia sp.]
PSAEVDIPEGDSFNVPITITTDPAGSEHPGFDLTVTATPTGGATGADYDPVTTTVNVPANATSATIPIVTTEDMLIDPGEGISLSIAAPASPPAGFEVTTNVATVQVNIIDDEVPPVDTTDPTVTINQASGQVDPTSVDPVLFTVEFSEPVTGFVNTDVVLSGSALPTSASVVGGPSVYTVSVSGMSVSGLVIADVVVGAAEDAAGNLSAASASTDNEVQFNLPPPGSSVVSIADGTIAEGGSANTTISMTNFVADRECSVSVTSTNGSAVEPGDY